MEQKSPWRFFQKITAGSSQSVISRNHGDDSRDLALAPDARVSLHDGGIAFLNIATGKIFLSNETGSEIWQGLAAGMSADAIAGKISSECGVRCDLVRRQTFSFITELERRGLVIRKAEY